MKKIIIALALSTVLLFSPIQNVYAVPPNWINHEASVFRVQVSIPPSKKAPMGLHGSGTAFYIGNGYFLTCAHVVRDIPEVKLHNDNMDLDAKVIWSKQDIDVALLYVNGSLDIPILKLTNNIPGIGEDLEAVGYPGGAGPLHIFGKVASTPVKPDTSNIDDDEDNGINHEIIAADMTTIAGESGGPIFNDKGEVIGIAEATWPVAADPHSYLPPIIAAEVPHSPNMGPIGFIIPNEVYKDLLPGHTNTGLTKSPK